MNCKVCGNPVSDDAVFCTQCGSVIKNSDIAEESATVEEAPVAVEETPEPVEFTSDDIAEEAPVTVEETPEPVEFASDDMAEETPVAVEETPEPVEFASDDIAEEAPVTAVESPEPVIFTSDDYEKASYATAQKATAEKQQSEPAVSDSSSSAEKTDENNSGEKKSDAPAKLTGARIFGAVIISILAVIFLTGFNIIFSARIGLSGDIIENSAKNLRNETLLNYTIDGEKTVASAMYEGLDNSFCNQRGIAEKDFKAFLEKSDLNEFIAENLGKYSAYIVQGTEKRPPSVTAEDIVEFVKDNKKASEAEFGFVLKDGDYDRLGEAVVDNGMVEALSIEEWGYSAGFYVGNLRFAFSFITIGMIFALVIVLFIWIAIVLDKCGRCISGFFGAITLISGIILALPSGAFVLSASAIALHTGNAIVYVCSQVLMPMALIALCTGVFEIVVGVIFIICNRALKKKEAKTAK